jgi:lipopolysaccharide export system permease protein
MDLHMRKLDWYILRKFLGTFFYAIGILIVITVVIDISEKLDDFVKSHLTVKQLIFEYYIGFIPHIAALLFPLFVFIAVIFFTSRLAYRSEIIAMLSAGISFRRMLRAYWVGGVMLCVMLWAGNRWVVPHADRIRDAFEDKYVNDIDESKQISNVHLRIDSFTYITMYIYDPIYKYASGFKLEKIRDQDMYYRLEAQNVRWDSTHKAWNTGPCVIRTFNGLQETARQLNDTSLKIPLVPEDLIQRSNITETLTTPELNAYIAREKLRGSEGINALYVEKYRRDASAVAVVILTLIGVAIASRKVRGGSGLHLAIGIVIGSAYIVVLQFSYTFSVKGNLSPFVAVWLPNLLFGAVAFALLRRAPK